MGDGIPGVILNEFLKMLLEEITRFFSILSIDQLSFLKYGLVTDFSALYTFFKIMLYDFYVEIVSHIEWLEFVLKIYLY